MGGTNYQEFVASLPFEVLSVFQKYWEVIMLVKK